MNEPVATELASQLSRRTLLRAALVGAAGLGLGSQLGGCGASDTTEREPVTQSQTSAVDAPGQGQGQVLLAFFSRAGENYYYGGRKNLGVGNTEVLAGMIGDRLGCRVQRIEAVEPYSDDYDDTVARNVREQDADARPPIANPLASLDGYDVVLLGSPIWNVRPPMIMQTFGELYDFAGKTVHPFTTHAMSGLGTAERDYRAACRGATIGEGLAVQGEEVAGAAAAVDGWLGRIGLLPAAAAPP